MLQYIPSVRNRKRRKRSEPQPANRPSWGMNMKKLVIGLWLAALSASVWAACSTHTYFVNGRTVMCTTCCHFGNCTTNCF